MNKKRLEYICILKDNKVKRRKIKQLLEIFDKTGETEEFAEVSLLKQLNFNPSVWNIDEPYYYIGFTPLDPKFNYENKSKGDTPQQILERVEQSTQKESKC